MIEVEILDREPGVRTRLGGVTIAASPLERVQDFHCTPSGLISFSQAQAIDAAISNDQVIGVVDEAKEWRQE